MFLETPSIPTHVNVEFLVSLPINNKKTGSQNRARCHALRKRAILVD
jgi:hypothetical protein